MSEIKTDKHEYITTEDGRRIRLDIFKAQIKSVLLKNQKRTLANLPNELKSDFYFKAYEILNRQTFEDKKEPIMQMGLSSYTFMREPVSIGNFQTTYGDLFSRIHQAVTEASGSFDLDAADGKRK